MNYSTQTYTYSNTQLPLFGAQHISPSDSATSSPNNASPISPRSQTHQQYHLPGQVRQLRPMKSPLYVPAALRPTERPDKNLPMTPPKSLHGSLDSLENGTVNEHSNNDSQRAALDIVVENNWIADEILEDVTGEPTRDHWKVSKTSSSLSLRVLRITPTCQHVCSSSISHISGSYIFSRSNNQLLQNDM